jgi:hypothetical protein
VRRAPCVRCGAHVTAAGANELRDLIQTDWLHGDEGLNMTLIKDPTGPARIPAAPQRDGAAMADSGENPSQTPRDRRGPSEGLQLELAAARELLAGTVEAVNPGTPRRELFAYVMHYRARLAGLVAACQVTGSRDGT